MRPACVVPLAVAALLGLSACSEPAPGSPLPSGGAPPPSSAPAAPTTDGASTTAPGPNPAPSPSDTSVGGAPQLPAEATTDDAAGAEAFVRHWFDTLNYAQASGDTQPLVTASHPSCDVCESYVSDIQGLGTSRVSNGTYVVEEAVAPAPDDTGSILVSVVTRQAEGQILDQSGSVLADISADDQSFGAVLIRVGDGWQMFGMGA